MIHANRLFALASMDSEEAPRVAKELPAAAWIEFRLGGVGLFVLLTKMAKINAQIDKEEAGKTLIQALDLSGPAIEFIHSGRVLSEHHSLSEAFRS